MSLLRRATVARRDIFLSLGVFRAIFARWLIPLRATASLFWGPQFSRVEDILKMILLHHATVARRDTFLQAEANFIRDPQIPRVSSFGSSRRPAACFLQLCLVFRPLTGFITASMLGTPSCFATSGFLSTKVNLSSLWLLFAHLSLMAAISSRQAFESASSLASNSAWLVFPSASAFVWLASILAAMRSNNFSISIVWRYSTRCGVSLMILLTQVCKSYPTSDTSVACLDIPRDE
jgi:hypothetical protein